VLRVLDALLGWYMIGILVCTCGVIHIHTYIYSNLPFPAITLLNDFLGTLSILLTVTKRLPLVADHAHQIHEGIIHEAIQIREICVHNVQP